MSENEIVVKQETAPVIQTEMSPVQTIMELSKQGIKIEDIREMLQLQKEYAAMEAEKLYVSAMAEFKKNPPEITKDTNVNYTKKDGTVVNYNHANLGNVTSKINSSLADHGFSVSWETTQPDNSIEVTCKITHKLGHCEKTSMKAPPDTSAGKNSIQAIASTVTYLERYTLLALTGLATHDQDDDGAGIAIEYVGDEKQGIIRDLLISLDSDEGKFLDWLECDSIDKMTEYDYKRAKINLEAKLEKKNADNN